MAKIPGLTLTKTEVSQELDLSEYGLDLTGLGDSEAEVIRQSIGQDIIDTIIDRTEDGISNEGRSFKSYDADYIDSDAFKAYGKSSSEVNLTLSGGMLADIDITKSENNKLEVAHVDITETAKAYNHNTPKSKANPLPRRPYFGVNKSELQKIIKPYKKQSAAQEATQEQANILAQLQKTEKQKRNDFNLIFESLFGGPAFGD